MNRHDFHHCVARDHPTGCSKDRALYIGTDGKRYCQAHLPDKRWRTSCTHTLSTKSPS